MKPAPPSADMLIASLSDAPLSTQARGSLWSYVLVAALREQERPQAERKHRRLADEWTVAAGSCKPAA